MLPRHVLADEVPVTQRGGGAAGVAAAVVPRLRHHGRRVEGPVGAGQAVGGPQVLPAVKCSAEKSFLTRAWCC